MLAIFKRFDDGINRRRAQRLADGLLEGAVDLLEVLFVHMSASLSEGEARLHLLLAHDPEQPASGSVNIYGDQMQTSMFDPRAERNALHVADSR
jgi:hypothetical protein